MSRFALRQAMRDPSAGVHLLRATASFAAVGVDRSANVLRGYVVAQAGPFKSEGRGEFDRQALETIISLGNAATRGLRAHFGHESLCSDALGTYLGRSSRLRMSTTTNAAGQRVDAVRADLTFDSTALKPPPKGGGRPLGFYVMELAESDPDAISSSLVLRVKKETRLNPDGTRQKDSAGEELPPLWRPYKLMASDIVSVGDAVDGLLSAADLRDAHLWEAQAVLSRLLSEGRLGELSRREIKERLNGWLDRALDAHFGADGPDTPRPRPIEASLLKYRLMEYDAMNAGAM